MRILHRGESFWSYSGIFLALLLFLSGCLTPLPPSADVSDAWRAGPFVEGASTDSGASMLAVRPFFSHEKIAETNDSRSVTDILWPVGTISQRQDNSHWRFLLFYGTRGKVPGQDDAYRFRLFPIYFQGRTREGENYMAIFPLGGKIHNFMTMSEVSFALFPLYASGRSAGLQWRSFLWPLYMERHGEHVDQIRVFPFYGDKRVERGGRNTSSRFVMWPLWTQTSVEGPKSSGHGFLLFPLYGHSKYEREERGTTESWTILPPFFSYAHGDDGFRKLHAPWPFIRQLDAEGRRERHIWPLHGSVSTESSKKSYVLWPFFSRSAIDTGGRIRTQTHAPLPFFYRKTEYVSSGSPFACAEEIPTLSYTRVWPLFSHRASNDGASFFRFPELSLWSGSEGIERNWAPLWSLFTRRTRTDGAACTDILWGLISWGHDSEGKGFFQFLWFLNFGEGSRTNARRTLRGGFE